MEKEKTTEDILVCKICGTQTNKLYELEEGDELCGKCYLVLILEEMDVYFLQLGLAGLSLCSGMA